MHKSVKKNKAANDPLITIGWILWSLRRNRATGIPPNVPNPFTMFQKYSSKIFPIGKLLIFLI